MCCTSHCVCNGEDEIGSRRQWCGHCGLTPDSSGVFDCTPRRHVNLSASLVQIAPGPFSSAQRSSSPRWAAGETGCSSILVYLGTRPASHLQGLALFSGELTVNRCDSAAIVTRRCLSAQAHRLPGFPNPNFGCERGPLGVHPRCPHQLPNPGYEARLTTDAMNPPAAAPVPGSHPTSPLLCRRQRP